MDVVAQGLVPGVQDRRDAERAAEAALGIGPEFQKRLRHRAKENVVDRRLVAKRDGIKLMRKREDKMEVRDRQKFFLPGLKPPRRGQRLALRAMAVAAGVVGGPLEAAAVATLAMSA
jgi:hypothetical protein